MRILEIAATGMMAQQTNVEVISNNIANINTTAFKRGRAEFSDLIYQSQQRQGTFSSDAGTIVPVGVQVGLGVKPAAVARITEQGSLQQTGNKLDVAIQGRGFFVVRMPDGTNGYTRTGTFQLSPDGAIVTPEGFELDPGVTLPENVSDIEINRSGEVFAFTPDNEEPVLSGRLNLATFINEAGLEARGDNMFTETLASGQPFIGLPDEEGVGSLRQGYVENSNVNVVEEVTDLISAQRAYEMNAKVIETADQMSQRVANMR
ncbi:flagellar basal-body rod protein FlgG [Parvularcula sp. ZS-1/3]|uniref:Flagellar basal-body rod protein FlgG n=1 Tax=Parvularcula mediterranea TaxID=2732508 RepID=A0A7Y3W674_9PROT|nr:flagellar basal-body rod protein FlgG [Parvularcula mediterranea]NNU17424.1 flagellar basal-body rod protein FlgG [Parvularcula mediterranea]